MKPKGHLTFSRLPKTYSGLVRLHMPRPIHDKVGLENALEVVDALAGHKLNQDQGDYLDILSDLVERYETENVAPLPEFSGIEMLKFLMEQQDVTGEGLAELLGIDRSLAFKILKGSRSLTTTHIKKLAGHFGVSADLFLR